MKYRNRIRTKCHTSKAFG